MSNLILCSLVLLVAYLLGSVPTGYLAGKLLQGIDIREQGSGSTGATNVLRTLGKVPAVVVLIVDALKGALAIALVYTLYLPPVPIVPLAAQPWLIATAALMAILGHSKSIWLNFDGGKSVATSLGVLLSMSWIVGLGTFGVFLAVLGLTRIVSLSSLAGAIAVGFLMIFTQQPLAYQVFAVAAGGYVFWRHRANIQRLLAGVEPQIGQKLS
jgi:acyl phosphate:glycerol-3-phosphate acyltransferase